MQTLVECIPSDRLDSDMRCSITIDPLLPEELRREATSLAIISAMEQRNFRSQSEAQEYLDLTMSRVAAVGAGRILSQSNAKLLVAEALTTKDVAKKHSRAREALRISSDCAEASMVLALLKSDRAARIEMLQKALHKAELQIDESKFCEPDGYFWQLLVTRPYMRCRYALTKELWDGGDHQEAVNHMKELLRLNPYDNQGLRYHLLNWLIECDMNDSEGDDYFGYYESDKAAFIKYACALQQFVRTGSTAGSNHALHEAVSANQFVPLILCGRVKFPKLSCTRVQRETPQEAIAYASIGGNAWRKQSGALEWLEENCAELLTATQLAKEIETAREFKPDGYWVSPPPLEIVQIFERLT